MNKLMKAEGLGDRCETCWNPGPFVFRDALSSEEFRISGMCQMCQDSVFTEENPNEYPYPTGELDWNDIRQAWDDGLVVLASVFWGQKFVLTLDVDEPHKLTTYYKDKAFLRRKLDALGVVLTGNPFVCASRSGNTHVYVPVEAPGDWIKFGAGLQTVAAVLLGSDPVREFLSAARAAAGAPYSHLMFETPENAKIIKERFGDLIHEVTPEEDPT